MSKRIDDYNDRPLYYRVMCPKGHHDGSGKSIKLLGRGCLACELRYPDGEFTTTVTNINPAQPRGNKKYYTEEEKKKARSKHSMAWASRNKEKHRAYVEKYQNKEEVKAAGRVKYREKYQLMKARKLAEQEKSNGDN